MIAELRRFALRLLNTLRPSAREADLERELLSHVALVEDEYRSRGLSPEDARLAARRAVGSVALAKDLHRDARSFAWLDDLRRDVVYALRILARTPGFSAIVILTIALGIGANTAIFSVLRVVLLQPLPYAHADRLVQPFENIPAAEMPNHRARRQGGMLVRELAEISHRSKAISHVVAVNFSLVTMMGAGDPTLLHGAALSPGTLTMLGVQPTLGRWFTQDEEHSGAHVLLLSDNVWHKYFGADPRVVGRTVTFAGNSSFVGDIVYGTAYTVVGVMPREFHFPNDDAGFWNLATPNRHVDPRQRTTAFAQLAEGVTPEAAAAEIGQILSDFRGATASHAPFAPGRFELERVEDSITAPVKPALLVLMATVGFVLLIACANVANLLLARTAAREREIAVRVSLGAGPGRLVRQMLTESLVLGLLGGAAGTGLAYGGIELFRLLGANLSRFDLGTTAVFPRLDAIAIDRLVFAFAFSISMLTGLLFGLAPAIRSTLRVQVRRSSRIHSALIVVELATALPLLIGGSLMIRSFVKLIAVDPGYDASHVLTFQVGARGDKYPPVQLKLFADDLAARLRTIPDVAAAGYARQLPMVQLVDTQSFRTTPEPPPPGPAPNGAEARYAGSGYLQAIGAKLVAGQWPDGPRQVAINQTLARREFGESSPIGSTVYVGRKTTPLEVAAVVEDERVFGLDREPAPQFFAHLSVWDGPAGILLPVGPYFAVRTRGSPEAVLRNVAAVVRQMDDSAPLYNVATLEQIVSNSVTLPRMYAVLLGVFAALAVGLAAIGLYGVMAYGVVRRTREIGIRMALGAKRSSVLALILRSGLGLTSLGLVIGVAAASATTRYLQSLLFGLTSSDATTFAAASLLFAIVAVVASCVPAWRATTVDPSVALRTE